MLPSSPDHLASWEPMHLGMPRESSSPEGLQFPSVGTRPHRFSLRWSPMTAPYRTIARPGSIELEIRKSRFICTIARAHSDEEARAFIADLKKRYWDASHNCSAYV